MSELLRAIMDANCVDKNVAVYTFLSVVAVPNTGVVTNGPQTVNVQMKTDTHFLCIGWGLVGTGTFNAANFVNNAESQDVRFQMNNLTTGMRYAFGGPTIRNNANFNLNNFVTLPEYPLFYPSDLIQAEMLVRATSTANNFVIDNTVCLVGMEYRMKGSV